MKFGFALGGGAVRGAAHIGVIREFERNDLRPTCIAGTSIGAVIGAAYAAGHSTERMRAIFRVSTGRPCQMLCRAVRISSCR